jgi:hypothetical protein
MRAYNVKRRGYLIYVEELYHNAIKLILLVLLLLCIVEIPAVLQYYMNVICSLHYLGGIYA